jgi:hypothetical protein
VSLMNSESRRQQQLEHLAHLRSLSKAVASAISAIEKNDLRQFETHLAVQETMCNRLSASSVTLSSAASTTAGDSAGPENSDTQLQKEIREAHAALANLNRVYAALLKQARKSVGLMLAIYRHHVPAPQCHTWSCEA